MDYKYKTNKEKDMKKGLITFISLFFITCCAYAESKIPIKILRIVDGDTIEAQINRNKFCVRLVGIDCYETCRIHRAYRQAYENNLSIDEVIKKGNESKHFLQKLYEQNKNNKVYLDFQGIDRYGRALGIIYFNKLNVNEMLENEGGCMVYEYKS
ncbi:TPA: hypothetical protein CPT95_05065 [Candidatus Gastranaerophilales bacterium HUM_15]|nr:MAG TPA: hypothetical protein CPT95_05065 [Candidatus Gastranaerophilales bacterium HUM_15]